MPCCSNGCGRLGASLRQVAELRQRGRSLREQPGTPGRRAVLVGERAIAKPEQCCRDRTMPDAADHQSGVRQQIQPPASFGRIGSAHRMPQARSQLSGPVLRSGQLDQQHGALRVTHAAAPGRG